MENVNETKAMNWKFDYNLISDEDKETILRAYHGDKWYETAASEDIHIVDVEHYTELNALIANGLLKTGFSEYEDESKQEKFRTYTVFSHKGLGMAEDFANFYFMRGDGESEADNVDAHTNMEIHSLLLKYRFW
jgi:hypothetical protein